MTPEIKTMQLEVSVQELKKGMTIKAYVGFDNKYTPLDENTCDWIKHNFQGASVKGLRNGAPFQQVAENLLPGDEIQEISEFPTILAHISRVNDRLIAELKERGFLRFRVQLPATSGGGSMSRADGVAQATHLLENMRQSIDLCENATTAVESLLDGARDGAPDMQGVQKYVEQMSVSEVTQTVSAIISLKENDHVYTHCVDVGVIFQQAYFAIIEKRGEQSAFVDRQEAMLGAFLHDIGKARISKEVFTSAKAFQKDGPEIQEIRKHPQIGAELLSEAGMSDVIVDMAHYHHVKLDDAANSSYPQGVKQSEVLFETRLLGLVDVYQALVAGRSYKKSWTPPAVMRYLDAMAGVEFDLDLWNEFQDVMGFYPVGSLVKLSDDSLAFVINVPENDLLKPHVIVVLEANGQQPSQNRFVDLADEPSLSIQKDLDAFEVFKSDALNVFSNLKVI